MPNAANTTTDRPELLEIECGSCARSLPLRLAREGEAGAVWLCAECSMPYVAMCIRAKMQGMANLVMLDQRYFDTSELPPISEALRLKVVQMASRPIYKPSNNQRRSVRFPQAMVAPAILLDNGWNPHGEPFQTMIANLSVEGIGLVHDAKFSSEFIAIALTPLDKETIQVIVSLNRSRELSPPFWEYGGEFYVRLGKNSAEEYFDEERFWHEE